MSGAFPALESGAKLFKKPKKAKAVTIETPRIPKQTPVEPAVVTEVVAEDIEEVKRRERKRLLTRGRRSTVLSGIQSALKKRLGE